MSAFHDAATPEDLPDYELEAEIARLERHTTETEDTAITEWFGGRQGRLDDIQETEPCP